MRATAFLAPVARSAALSVPAGRSGRGVPILHLQGQKIQRRRNVDPNADLRGRNFIRININIAILIEL